MALLNSVFEKAGDSLKDALTKGKGGINLKVNGGYSAGVPPTQMSFNPMLVAAGIGLLVLFMFTNKRR